MAANDIHVYPVSDLHDHVVDGPGCPYEPVVEVIGATLLYIHNSWDHREIVEQAIDIMNGVDPDGNP